MLSARGGCTSLAPEARADETIGLASVVRNDVSGVLVSGTVKVDTGASVVRNEIMKTADDSSAKLVFTDRSSWTTSSPRAPRVTAR